MKSILQEDHDCCYLCGGYGGFEPLDWHHCFGGRPNRSKSETYGLKVRLHHNTCHETGRNAVHNNKYVMAQLHKDAQLKAMEYYGWSVEDFIRIFGRNFLNDKEFFT